MYLGQSNDTAPVSVIASVTQVYDPIADKWYGKKNMPTPRSSLCAAAVKGQIYVMGGVIVTPATCTNANEVYDATRGIAPVASSSKVNLNAETMIGVQTIPANVETTVSASGWLRTMADKVSGTIKMKKGSISA